MKTRNTETDRINKDWKTDKTAKTEKMITVTGLHKNFGKINVLKNVNFEVTEPGIYAVLGHNGSGKTTLLKMLLGMVIPDQGEIDILNRSINEGPDYRQNIAYLPQIARFPENLTVRELINMILDIRNSPGQEDPLISRFELGAFLDKKLSDLSGGTRQKVNLVLAFMFDVDIYILDEPTAGLDPVALIELKGLIEEEKKKGKLILITTHIMSLVEELADEVLFLQDGHIHFQGSLDVLNATTKQVDLEHAIAAMLKQSQNGHSRISSQDLLKVSDTGSEGDRVETEKTEKTEEDRTQKTISKSMP